MVLETEKSTVAEEEIEEVIKRLEEREEGQKVRFEKEKDKLKNLSSPSFFKPKKPSLPIPISRKLPVSPSPLSPSAPATPVLVPSPKSQPKPPSRRRVSSYLALFLFLILLTYSFLNYRLLILHLKYLYAEKVKKQPFSLEASTKHSATQLIVSKIGLKTPVNKKEINPKTDVFFQSETTAPDQDEKLVIIGPSSIYPWQIGQPVFGLLNYISPNDSISLIDQGETYLYKVIKKKITSSSSFQREINLKKTDLILATPWPPGLGVGYLTLYAQKTITSSESESEAEVFLPTIGP